MKETSAFIGIFCYLTGQEAYDYGYFDIHQ